MAGDHTAGVLAPIVLLAGTPGTSTVADASTESVDFTLGSVAVALAWACVAAIPLGVSLWALLDAARRPRWAWALAGRRQIVWMAAIMLATVSLVGGLVVSGWYLTRVRPALAATEAGRLS